MSAAPIAITVVDGLTCANCGAPEVEDNTLPVADWRFNIRAFRVDDWSECRKCGAWFNLEGAVDLPRLTLTIPGRLSQDVADFAAASAAYAQARDLSGEGASTFPGGTVNRNGSPVPVARVSYNGRVWLHAEDKPLGGGQLVYCPGSAAVDDGRPDVFNEGRESVWGKPRDNPHDAGSLEHRVFEAGAAFARRCLPSA